MGLQQYSDSIKAMIDALKALSTDLGLSNTGDEYKIISELFTYKFLNDKLLFEFEHRKDKEETFEEFVYYADSKTAKMNEEHLVHNLYHKQNQEDFHKIFDIALEEVSELNKDIYSVETTLGNKKPLFEPLSVYLRDEDKELELAKRAINILYKYKFSNIFDGGFDYFSTIFQYLLKDYNKDSGKYAEYFTPLSTGKIIAKILYNDTPVTNVTIYDPAAGSGTLVLSLADLIGTNNCTIYTQDISQKSTQFLRINFILNKLSHSLNFVKEGNTLTTPAHKDGEKLRKYHFIVSNPPFKTDFSSMVETLKTDPYKRFFAGIPKVPDKKKESMSIYLPFLQHIIYSLKDKVGKAAIVVPTGFLTAQSGIEFKIREKLIKEKMLKGVVSMPSNIFATTGTNVSILFLDKANTEGEIVLVDASKLGSKVKDGKNQKTVLSPEEEQLIINTFINKEKIENLSVTVSYADIISKHYNFSAGPYFELKMEHIEISQEEFENKLSGIKKILGDYFKESKSLEKEILMELEDLKYD